MNFLFQKSSLTMGKNSNSFQRPLSLFEYLKIIFYFVKLFIAAIKPKNVKSRQANARMAKKSWSKFFSLYWLKLNNRLKLLISIMFSLIPGVNWRELNLNTMFYFHQSINLTTQSYFMKLICHLKLSLKIFKGDAVITYCIVGLIQCHLIC